MIKIGLDTLKIDSNGMVSIVKLCIGVLVVCIVLKGIKYNSEVVEIPDVAEGVFNLFKAAGYTLLAWYIYTIMKSMQFPKIDVLTFFTFLLACFEAAHNCMNSLGNCLALVIAGLLPKIK